MSDSYLPPVMVEFGGNATKGLAAITKMVTNLERLGKAATTAAEATTKAFAAMERGAAVMEQVAAAADVAKKSMLGLSRASNAVAKATEKAAAAADAGMTSIGASAERMAAAVDASATAAGTGLAALTAESRVAAGGLRASSAETAAAGAASATAGSKVKDLGSKYLGLGAVLSKLKTIGPLSLGAIAVASLDMGMKFDASMTLLVTQAGLAPAKLQPLKDGVLDLASKVGFSATELSHSLFHIESGFASMGISSADALKMTEVAAKGAAVGHSDLVRTTTALTAVMASGYVPITKVGDAMGVLNAMVGSGEMTMEDLTKAFSGGALAVVKGFGATIQDAGAALAVFGDNNIRGAAAGTMFRMSVQALAQPVATAKTYLKEFGMTHDTLAKDMQKGGMKLALQDLEDHFKKAGIGAKEQGQVITEMFGKKAGAGVSVLLGQYDRTLSKYEEMDKGVHKFGAAWETTKKTLSQQFKSIGAGIDSVLIRIGEKLIPKVSDLITLIGDKGTPVVHAFADAFSQIASGFEGPKPAAAPARKASTASLFVPAGAKASAPSMLAPVVPDLTAWQKVGKVFSGVSSDLQKFGSQVGTAFSNLLSAAQPTLEMLAGLGLGTLRAIGSVLTGVVGPALVEFTGFLNGHKTMVQAIVATYLIYRGLLLGMAVAQKAVAIASKIVAITTRALAAAQWLLNAAMSANPIGLIIILLAGLALGAMYCWQHFQTFRDVVMTVFVAVTQFVGDQVKSLVTILRFLADSAMDHIAALLSVMGHLPGFGWAKKASEDIKGFKRTFDSAMDGVKSKIDATQAWAKQQQVEVKIRGNIADLTKNINDAKAQLSDKNLPPAKRVALQANIAQLTAQRNLAQSQIDALHGKVVPITVAYHTTGGAHGATLSTAAAGAIWSSPRVRAFASGGEDHSAQIARGGDMRLWAEPETGGEAYIPLASSKRGRSRSIAERTVGILGGHVEWGGKGGAGGSGAMGAVAAFSRMGAAIPMGLAQGVGQGSPAAHDAVRRMARGTVAAFSEELGIASPSKKFKSLGAYVVTGLVQGLTGSTASVTAATKRIASYMYIDFGSTHKGTQQIVNQDNKALLTLAARRDAVAAKLKAANANLAKLQKSWAEEQKSVAGSIMQSASVVMAAPEDGSTLTSFQVIDQMQDRMQKTLQFAANLKMAQKNGLSAALVAQIAAAGVDQGGATAQALASATKGQIDQLNALQTTTQSAANDVGAAVADSMYGAGIKAAQGLIKGLAAQQKAIEAQMLRIALAMQAAIKKALGIKSPSAVFADLGQYIPQGLAKGITAGTHHATTAAKTMSGAVAGAGSRSLAYAGGGGAGGTTVINNYYYDVTVEGTVTSERNLADALQSRSLRRGANNSQTYQAFRR